MISRCRQPCSQESENLVWDYEYVWVWHHGFIHPGLNLHCCPPLFPVPTGLQVSNLRLKNTLYIYIYLLGLDFGFHDFTFPCHWGLPNEHRYTDISHESPSLQRPAKARRTAALRSQNHRAEYLLQSSKVWHPVPLSHSWLMDVYFPKYGNDIMIGLDPSP